MTKWLRYIFTCPTSVWVHIGVNKWGDTVMVSLSWTKPKVLPPGVLYVEEKGVYP